MKKMFLLIFLVSCIQFKESPWDPMTPSGILMRYYFYLLRNSGSGFIPAVGELDPTFNGNGKVTTDFGVGSNDFAYAIALQSDGKILVAGGSNNDFAVVRYNSYGSLDGSFGSGGKYSRYW
ncbi:MAG: delta-60 repeat domain-containing protein [Leptonema sp. (in: bacteria)]